jgi:hypothetical protein
MTPSLMSTVIESLSLSLLLLVVSVPILFCLIVLSCVLKLLNKPGPSGLCQEKQNVVNIKKWLRRKRD